MVVNTQGLAIIYLQRGSRSRKALLNPQDQSDDLQCPEEVGQPEGVLVMCDNH